MTESGVRPLPVAIVFGVALTAIVVALYLWWPAGVVVGIVLCTVATIVIGRHLQRQDETVPVDQELLELLDVAPPAGGGGVTRTVLAGQPARGRSGASIR